MNPRSRVVFMGTPDFSVPTLEALAKAFEVVAVYTQPDRPGGRGLQPSAPAVKKAAEKLGLPVFQPEKLKQPGVFEQLEAFKPDFLVVVAYGQILKRNVLDLPKLGSINIHASLLPRWRGAAPIHRSLLAGDAETGITTMMMAEKLDAGDILLQSKTPISSNDTAGTLHDRLAKMGADLIIPTLEGLANGTLKRTTQDEKQVTYAEKLTKEMEALDPFHKTADELHRQVRGLQPWPGTSVTVLNALGQPAIRLKIKKVQKPVGGAFKESPGRIFERSGMLLLSTAQGCLELLSVQWDGRKEVDAAGFLNGLRGSGQELPLELKSTSS